MPKLVINNAKIRDCVRLALENGCSKGHEFRKMRHAIISELHQLGHSSSQIKDALIEWNKKCRPPLDVGDIRRQLIKYVDWALSQQECKSGCQALEDYCVGKKVCTFYKIAASKNQAKVNNASFDPLQLEQYLTQVYQGKGYAMMLVAKALKMFQLEKGVGDLIYVGCRVLSTIIRDHFGHTLSHMEVHRIIKLLEDERVIEQVVKGKPGHFSWQANGYRFLEWRKP